MDALKHSYEILKIFIEQGESARTTNRTKLKELMLFIGKNTKNINAVIVSSFDRFSRDQADSILLVKGLEKLNIKVLSVTQPNENSSAGKLMRNIFSSFAQFEVDLLAERTTNGMKQAMLNGRWCTSAPLGYKNIRINNKAFLEKTEDSIFIKEALELFSTGLYNQQTIITKIRSKGFKKLLYNNFSKILRNPIYAGYIHKPEWDIKYVSGLHEAIISKEVFFINQDLLSKRKIKKKKIDKFNPEFPLKSFVFCAECKMPFTGSKSRSKSKIKYPYYHGYGDCRHRFRKEKLEDDFINLLNQFQPAEIELDLFREILIDCWKEKENSFKTESLDLQKRLTEINKKIERIEELAINGTFTQESYNKNYEKYYNEKMEIEINLDNSKRQLNENLEELVNFGIDILYNISNFWKNADIETKIKFENFLFPEGLSYDKNEGFQTPKTSVILKDFSHSYDINNTGLALRGIEPLFDD